jgi:hypothetical protein
MNDERFNRDLGTVLRAIAGEEAPMSLRNRLARITDEAPIGRRLWFAPPLRLATAAVVFVAVVALAILLVPRETVGPLPSASAEPSASASESLEPSPSVEPSVEPTSAPTPTVVTWTGLDWSAGVTPFAPNTSYIADIVWWGDGYIGVGGTFASAGPGLGTVFSSTDGLDWSVAYQAELPTDWAFEHVVPLGDGLLALSNQRGVACEGEGPCPPAGFDVAPRLWYSPNGADWSQIDSQSWRDALDGAVPFDVVGGRDGVGHGVAAVLSSGAVVHSIDGQTWRRAELPASQLAIPTDVTAFRGGFVIVGRDGQPDPHSQVNATEPLPGVGRPAAWVSADGIDWVEATVEGSAVAGGELRDVAAGVDGLFAAGIADAVDTQAHAPTHGWTSADGLSWTIAGRIGEDLPLFGGELLAQGLLVGDGSRMVILGPESTESTRVIGSVSTDGVSWAPLAFVGAETDFHTGYWGDAGPQGVRYLTSAVLMPTGVIAHVYSGDNELWFGTGVGAGR